MESQFRSIIGKTNTIGKLWPIRRLKHHFDCISKQPPPNCRQKLTSLHNKITTSSIPKLMQQSDIVQKLMENWLLKLFMSGQNRTRKGMKLITEIMTPIISLQGVKGNGPQPSLTT